MYCTKNLIIIEQDPRISYPSDDYDMTPGYTWTSLGFFAIIIMTTFHYCWYDSESNDNLQQNKYLIFVISGLPLTMLACLCVSVRWTFCPHIIHISGS